MPSSSSSSSHAPHSLLSFSVLLSSLPFFLFFILTPFLLSFPLLLYFLIPSFSPFSSLFYPPFFLPLSSLSPILFSSYLLSSSLLLPLLSSPSFLLYYLISTRTSLKPSTIGIYKLGPMSPYRVCVWVSKCWLALEKTIQHSRFVSRDVFSWGEVSRLDWILRFPDLGSLQLFSILSLQFIVSLTSHNKWDSQFTYNWFKNMQLLKSKCTETFCKESSLLGKYVSPAVVSFKWDLMGKYSACRQC